MEGKVKDTLIVYLKEGIIVFPFHLYINKFLCKVLDKLFEWEITSSKKPKFSGREKYFKFFVEKEIKDILLEIKIIYKNLNLKVITIYNQNYEVNFDYSDLIENQTDIIKSIKKIYKNIAKKYFIENLPQTLKFENDSHSYKGIKCGKPLGDEIEFLLKFKKTWTNT